jgi:hypothetical protein
MCVMEVNSINFGKKLKLELDIHLKRVYFPPTTNLQTHCVSSFFNLRRSFSLYFWALLNNSHFQILKSYYSIIQKFKLSSNPWLLPSSGQYHSPCLRWVLTSLYCERGVKLMFTFFHASSPYSLIANNSCSFRGKNRDKVKGKLK